MCPEDLEPPEETVVPELDPQEEAEMQELEAAEDEGPRDPDEPLLVFIHIQKTAGKSLRRILYDAHPGTKGRVVLNYNYFTRREQSYEAMRAVAEDPPARLNVIHGHVLFWPDIQRPEHTKFCSILRDPVERVISHYYWLRQREPKFALSLDEAVSKGAVPANLQTRVLGAADASVTELTPETLEAAVAALDRLDVVGLTERFDESVALMTRAFGWPWLPYAKQNVTADRKPRAEIPDATIALIEEYNALDIELHRRAAKRLDDDLAKAGPLLTTEIEAIQRANERLGALEAGESLAPLHPAAVVDGVGDDLHAVLVNAMTELVLRDHQRAEAVANIERAQRVVERVEELEQIAEQQRERVQELTEQRNQSRDRLVQANERLKAARETTAKRTVTLEAANKELVELRRRLQDTNDGTAARKKPALKKKPGPLGAKPKKKPKKKPRPGGPKRAKPPRPV